VVVHPRGFLCTVWSCRHSRVRVVGGRSCLQALHPSSSSLVSFLCAVIACRPRRMSSASRVLIVVVCPRHVIVSCPPRHCPVLLSLPCPHCDVLFGCTTWHLLVVKSVVGGGDKHGWWWWEGEMVVVGRRDGGGGKKVIAKQTLFVCLGRSLTCSNSHVRSSHV